MKRFLLCCLKAGLIGLVFVPCILWAADSPRVTVDQSPVGANKADIGFTSVINGDNHMDVVISSGSGQGCSAGQYWDIGVGGCTSPIQLRTETTSQSCSCTCPEKGSCTSSQNGTYPVFGWRLPTAGNELISGYGPTTWGPCQVVSNACTAGDGPPPGGGDTGTPPASGTTFIVQAFICDASHPDYNNGPLGTSDKSDIINTYRRFNFGMRCPELGGYVFWQNSWVSYANDWLASNPGSSMQLALVSTWAPLQQAMNQSAEQNHEGDPSYATFLNGVCSNYASAQYGVPLSATYIINSGSSCIVN